ncbi:chemotaxis protein CheA [Rhodovulum euryhalinum]|uniref:Chemotaxis protein CheA n=1 Tax=Rhodovulum euryhalinum TaxID=35805 RepID=A0A4R2KLN4_9RHOB|nr:chemotaxis protein CheA [Rhodovulum euryhalinum]TCO71606.1 two-component system chemotaxis sensor kinase CheA [Rhodovulum euryhalinum]
MTQDEDADSVFLAEAAELQAGIERNLLDLAEAPDNRDLIDALFRDLHTLKGSGAMFGHVELAHFLHGFETAFEALREPGGTASDPLIRVALQACDQIGALLENPSAASPGNTPILDRLAAALDKTPGDAPESLAEVGWRIDFALGPDALGLGTNVPALLSELEALAPGHVRVNCDLSGLPPLETLNPLAPQMSWTVVVAAPVSREAIDEVFLFVRDDLTLTVEPFGQEAAATTVDTAPDSATARPERRGAAEHATMRVATTRLDEIMDRVGELVIAESRLHDLSQTLRDATLMAVAEDIRRLASGMRETTMSIRMVPIGNLFGRFRRLVHDLSEQLGKPMECACSGGETELDKTVIEVLTDPLVHILRNAADHGLENGEARAAAGKPHSGTISLSAAHAGAEVHIRIHDDGRGLDDERLRNRAIERDLLPPGSTVSGPDLYRLIFEPGFSTATTVTELSGRGVGMDVVRSAIQSLRGQIDVDSEPGHGTTVTLRLPLTLAIADGLLVDVGGERYSIPVSAVEECVELPHDLISGSGRSSFLDIRGELVPFLRLADVFETPGPRSEFQKVVIVAGLNGRVGLVVDRIVSNAQTVIKQLSRVHAGVKAFSGATILGDGKVALILDVGHLISLGRTLEDRMRIQQGAA